MALTWEKFLQLFKNKNPLDISHLVTTENYNDISFWMAQGPYVTSNNGDEVEGKPSVWGTTFSTVTSDACVQIFRDSKNKEFIRRGTTSGGWAGGDNAWGHIPTGTGNDYNFENNVGSAYTRLKISAPTHDNVSMAEIFSNYLMLSTGTTKAGNLDNRQAIMLYDGATSIKDRLVLQDMAPGRGANVHTILHSGFVMPSYYDYRLFTTSTYLKDIVSALPSNTGLIIELNISHPIYTNAANKIPMPGVTIEITKATNRFWVLAYRSDGAKTRAYPDMWICDITNGVAVNQWSKINVKAV